MDSDSGDESPGFLPYTPLSASTMAAQMEHLADEDAGPKLGADMADIRARVLGRRAGISTAGKDLTSDEHKEVYRELQKQHQVDLNEEANASALEDPTLIAHMEGARRRLAEHEREMLQLPRLEETRAKYLRMMGKLATLLRSLEDHHMAERENVELGFRQGRVLSDLLEGRKPHGYPALGGPALSDPGTVAALGLAAEKADNVAKSYEAFLEFVEESRQTLFVLRREFETVADALIEINEATDEDRRRLREVLLVASKAKAIKNTADPEGSLGELLLASKALPEKTGLKAIQPGEE